MKRFDKPPIGSIITIVTRHSEILLEAESKWRDTTYSDVEVLPPEHWFGPNDIKITGNERMPFRRINMDCVTDLKIGDRESASSEIRGRNGPVPIQGSSGEIYMVTLLNGDAMSCTCPHHTYRRATCKHMKQAVSTHC